MYINISSLFLPECNFNSDIQSLFLNAAMIPAMISTVILGQIIPQCHSLAASI